MAGTQWVAAKSSNILRVGFLVQCGGGVGGDGPPLFPLLLDGAFQMGRRRCSRKTHASTYVLAGL